MRSLSNVVLREADVMLLEDGFDTSITEVREASGEVGRRDDEASRVLTVTEELVILDRQSRRRDRSQLQESDNVVEL